MGNTDITIVYQYIYVYLCVLSSNGIQYQQWAEKKRFTQIIKCDKYSSIINVWIPL